MNRKCKKCGEVKDIEEFVTNKTCKEGKAHTCKVCDAKRRKKHREDNPDMFRDTTYKYLYGISLEDYNTMFKEQEGKCAGCGKHQLDLNHRLVVDHCHTSGEVRGLLCNQCNSVLGYVYDDPKTLKNLIKYLEKGNT